MTKLTPVDATNIIATAKSRAASLYGTFSFDSITTQSAAVAIMPAAVVKQAKMMARDSTTIPV